MILCTDTSLACTTWSSDYQTKFSPPLVPMLRVSVKQVLRSIKVNSRQSMNHKLISTLFGKVCEWKVEVVEDHHHKVGGAKVSLAYKKLKGFTSGSKNALSFKYY
jgi:hypothetical protein